MTAFTITQKSDLASAAFANDNSVGAGGITIRTDAGSVVKTFVDAAIGAIPPQGSATPSGAAGGALSGTYPNPTLNSSLAIPASQITGVIAAANLPSYVDDVLEFANLAAFHAVGESGKIYVAADSSQSYRWSGSAYVSMVAQVPQATNTSQGTVALNNGTAAGDDTNNTDALTAAGLNALLTNPTPASNTAIQNAIQAIAAAAAANVSAPAGIVTLTASPIPPTGWLVCNGSALSRTVYSALFAAIGTTYGTGDGSTTFNIPDLRGEFLRGFDDGRGVDAGRVFGSLQTQQIQSHSHTVLVYQANDFNSNNFVTGTDDVHNSGAYVNGTGSTGGTETRPRNVALLACIKY